MATLAIRSANRATATCGAGSSTIRRWEGVGASFDEVDHQHLRAFLDRRVRDGVVRRVVHKLWLGEALSPQRDLALITRLVVRGTREAVVALLQATGTGKGIHTAYTDIRGIDEARR